MVMATGGSFVQRALLRKRRTAPPGSFQHEAATRRLQPPDDLEDAVVDGGDLHHRVPEVLTDRPPAAEQGGQADAAPGAASDSEGDVTDEQGQMQYEHMCSMLLAQWQQDFHITGAALNALLKLGEQHPDLLNNVSPRSCRQAWQVALTRSHASSPH